jgi:hypothetical protein
MRHALKLHPSSHCDGATHVEVEVAYPRARRLELAYSVQGKISALLIAPVTVAARTDELWRHTCFEAFARPSSGSGYYEFNFSPSTCWAAFWFESYRSGMRVAREVGPPRIEVRSSADRYMLQATLEIGQASSVLRDGRWRLGLSAVIEERNGRKSYWALAHPPGEADFHHADCFAHEILRLLEP